MLQTPFEDSAGTHALWYSVPEEYGGYLQDADNHDAQVLGLLLRAMSRGEDIVLKGRLSEKLYYNLSNYAMYMLSQQIPGLKMVSLYPEELYPAGPHGSPGGVATGFSAGIDSFTVLNNHFFRETPAGYRITHLFFNNHGSRTRARRNRLDRIRRFSSRLGLPLITVDSNLRELLPVDIIRSHTIRNISMAMTMQALISKYYYASGLSYGDCYVGPSLDSANLDPFLVHLLSTNHMEAISSGCESTRVEKTRLLSTLPATYSMLDVCADTVDPHERREKPNCSLCFKCCRTMMTLELLGRLELYEEVFDLERWRRVRDRYIRYYVLNRKSPLCREIIDLANASGFRFPLSSHVVAFLRSALPDGLKDATRQLLPAFRTAAGH